MTTHRTIAQVGNFLPPHSTENHLSMALRHHGHTVEHLQENDPDTWAALANMPRVSADARPDLVLWTRTWALDHAAQRRALDACRVAGVPVVGYHLDRWWGLDREHQVHDEPFFRADLVVTADGGHDDQWAEAGVRHWWAPPAVLAADCTPGVPHGGVPPIIFVGSWTRYHPEWPWRRELIRQLTRTYGRRFGLYPNARTPRAYRGQALNDLYASAQIVVGDSCLTGSAARYWSDRVPETIGRGGLLIHPRVEGMTLRDGEHLVLTEPESWISMRDAIDSMFDQPYERGRIAETGRAEVMRSDTYETRMAWLLDRLEAEGMLPMVRGGAGPVTVHTSDVGPATFDLRPDTTDWVVVDETWNEKVYGLDRCDVEGKVVVDVGANVGSFTVWAAQAGATRVVAVEPVPASMERLVDHVAANGCDQVQTMPVAVDAGWDHDRSMVLEPGLEGGAHLVPPGHSVPADLIRLDVETVPLAHVVAEAGGHVDVLKIDVEGGEYDAIAGAAADGTLGLVDRIVGEWHPLTDHITAGRFLAGLLRYGKLTIFGVPEVGGQFEWRRYGA